MLHNIEKNLQYKGTIVELIFDNMFEGCQIIDFEFRYRYLNKAVVLQSHKKKQELLGKTMMEMYPGIEKTEVFNQIKQCMKNRTFHTMENEFEYPNGEKGWFELRMEPVPEGVLIFSLDITKRKTTEKAKSEFVAIASHALRTPLGITKWYLEAISEQGYLSNAPDTVISYLDEIYKNNERILLLVKNFLSVSHIDSGKNKNVLQKTNVLKLIKKIVKDMQIAALKDHISITLQIQRTNFSSISIDPLRLSEVVENILSNAIKYSPAHGKIKVILTKKGTQFFIAIKDTGIGITREDQKKIFSKFFRAKNAVTKNTEGSGLGLYIAKSYIEALGGRITLTSTEGKGATFSITVPIKGGESR